MLHHVIKFSAYTNSLTLSTDSDSCVSHEYHRNASNSVLLLDSKVLICIHLQQCWSTWRDEGILLSFTHILKLPHGSTHRRAPGTEWYSLPGSDLLSHYMFVFLYLQTIHRTDLSREESAPQTWIISPGHVLFRDQLRIPSGVNRLRALVIIWPPPWIRRKHPHCWSVCFSVSSKWFCERGIYMQDFF